MPCPEDHIVLAWTSLLGSWGSSHLLAVGQSAAVNLGRHTHLFAYLPSVFSQAAQDGGSNLVQRHFQPTLLVTPGQRTLQRKGTPHGPGFLKAIKVAVCHYRAGKGLCGPIPEWAPLADASGAQMPLGRLSETGSWWIRSGQPRGSSWRRPQSPTGTVSCC